MWDVIDKPAATTIKGDGGIDIVNICGHQVGDNGPSLPPKRINFVLPIFSTVSSTALISATRWAGLSFSGYWAGQSLRSGSLLYFNLRLMPYFRLAKHQLLARHFHTRWVWTLFSTHYCNQSLAGSTAVYLRHGMLDKIMGDRRAIIPARCASHDLLRVHRTRQRKPKTLIELSCWIWWLCFLMIDFKKNVAITCYQSYRFIYFGILNYLNFIG